MIDDDLSTVNSALACHSDERTRAAWERLRAWATDAHKALRATALYRDGSETDMWPPQLELAARQLTRDLISSMTTDEAIANLTARAKWCRRWVALHGGPETTIEGERLATEAEAIETLLASVAALDLLRTHKLDCLAWDEPGDVWTAWKYGVHAHRQTVASEASDPAEACRKAVGVG